MTNLKKLVSILVLLEVPLRRGGWHLDAICEHRFNPCFAGSSS